MHTIEEIKAMIQRAKAGDAVTQFKLGYLLSKGGDRVIKDEKKAVDLYRRAAEHGYAPAQSNLGYMLLNGKGTVRDTECAILQYRLAAAQRYAPAQCALGYMLQHGIGMAKDEKGAVALYRLAADQKFAPAQYNLGVMLKRGIGMAIDEKAAEVQYQLAAAQEHVPAVVALIRMQEGRAKAEKGVSVVKTVRTKEGSTLVLKPGSTGQARTPHTPEILATLKGAHVGPRPTAGCGGPVYSYFAPVTPFTRGAGVAAVVAFDTDDENSSISDGGSAENPKVVSSRR